MSLLFPTKVAKNTYSIFFRATNRPETAKQHCESLWHVWRILEPKHVCKKFKKSVSQMVRSWYYRLCPSKKASPRALQAISAPNVFFFWIRLVALLLGKNAKVAHTTNHKETTVQQCNTMFLPIPHFGLDRGFHKDKKAPTPKAIIRIDTYCPC